ncbi:Nucleotidyltransferase [Lepidopterella palustris CBS 459.81]|uniref:DNA-directed DNA polymerase n=1 Tax=Lepidopterella palustris CBS 459.81 TaxID=1314670 RepID=A0A8E2E809_9PEZI|nr:Nucleotidyltransferase [Lepidopterella palustris CBS 459.81]
MSNPPSSQTLAGSSPSREDPSVALDLSVLPPVFVLSAHFNDDELHDVKERLVDQGVPLTFDVSEAKIFVGKVGTKRRAEFELRSLRLWTEEVAISESAAHDLKESGPARKKRRVETAFKLSKVVSACDESITEGETTEDESVVVHDLARRKREPSSPILVLEEGSDPALDDIEVNGSFNVIKVVKLDWLDRSIDAGRLLLMRDYLVYEGKRIDPPATTLSSQPSNISVTSLPAQKITPASQHVLADRPQAGQDILERAKSDASAVFARKSNQRPFRSGHGLHRFENKSFASQSQKLGHSASHMTHLLQQTTSDYEGENSDIPEPPIWVKAGFKYACQRRTPANPPNDPFIEQLKKIRKARILSGDEIGVRAYSTSIAALASYPYPVSNPREILSLPGCDVKIANLWVEWKNTGHIKAADDAENDETMKVLRIFYDIWGVGASTAREFYFSNHWRDLDDVVEYGWNTLTRVQQIGVKYYTEFLEPIPRAEVESIASTVRAHAIRVRDDRISLTIVGGYRRGKEACGDVDMIVSHPDISQTANLVTEIIASLEGEKWVTHTLLLSLNGTNRGQATLPFRSIGPASHGFDTLDKALVVWQDPVWATKDADLAANPKAKNPNIHRRVDIIVSPWRTVGCAVMGWSGGTTFQRDLRRYAKHVKGWKFDSSGVRDRRSGMVVELEGPEGVSGTAEEAERRVFEGLGLRFVESWERCTG